GTETEGRAPRAHRPGRPPPPAAISPESGLSGRCPWQQLRPSRGAALGACNGGAWDMRWGQFVAAIAAGAIITCGTASTEVSAAPPISLQADGSIQMAARKLRCGDVRNVLDRRLLNLGISMPDAKLL